MAYNFDMQAQPISSQENLTLQALSLLEKAGVMVNQIRAGDTAHLNEALANVAFSANAFIRGSWAAIIPADPDRQILDFSASVSTGETAIPFPEAFAMQAFSEREPLFSYHRPPALHFPEGPAMACYPFAAGDRLLGVLVSVRRDQNPFSEVEKAFLSNLANLACAAIHQAGSFTEIQQNLQRKEEELGRLRQAGLLISSRLQLEETLEAIVQMALEVTNAQYGIFRLVDRSGKLLITRAVAGERLNRPLVDALPIAGASIMGWVARQRQPVCIPDLRLEPWRSLYYPLDLALDMRSELAVPLIGASGRLEGVLNLESPQVGGFSDQDRHLLQSLATQAVIAIQEVRLLDALQEVAQLLLSQSSQKVLARLVALACDLLNADTSAIWIIKENRLALQAAFGSLRLAEHPGLEDSLAGKVIAGRGSRSILDRARWELSDLVAPDGPVNALAVPLLTSESRQPAGAFGVFSPAPDSAHFAESEWDKKVLTCLAYYAALSVQHASHQDELRAAREQRAVAETFAAIGDIAANVLHNLNNKVGTIPVRIQGIRDKSQAALSADAYLSANLNEIERSANEAMESVRENLSHLRPITLAEVNVARCVNSAIESARLPSGIAVQTHRLAELPPVVAAHRSLSLVFTNLLDNAQDAMGGQGSICITGKRDEGWVEVTLVDSGPGIPPELHERIFELSYSGRSQGRGSKLGFGLWWVKTLMARLGGSVSVESDGVHGATFRVRLPVAGGKP